MITGIEYINMSKHDIYEEYCKIYKKYEMLVEREINRLKAESNNLKMELLSIQNPISCEVRGYDDVDCGRYMAEHGEEYPKTDLICKLLNWIKKILLKYKTEKE